MRVLDTRTKEVSDNLVVVDHPSGYRQTWRGEHLLAMDSDDDLARVAHFALAAGLLVGKSVAWLGGGLCLGPRLFAVAGCRQTVYEIEPALAEFCPEGVRFVPGDWQTTIRGQFDVIVYDLGGDVPRESLERHLAPGGMILS